MNAPGADQAGATPSGQDGGRASLILYSQSSAFSLILGILTLLVPFYLLELGYSFGQLGIIISAQGVFQVGLRLFGGVMADRVGERWVILASFGSLLAGALLMALAPALAAIIVAQLLIGAARSVYWTASQSYGSRILEGGAGKFLGRFFGFSSAGQMVGSFIGGWIAGYALFAFGFGVCAALAGLSILLTFVMPELPRRMARTIKQILKPVPSVFLSRWTLLPAICAFGASLSMALLGSLIPAYLRVDVGYAESTIGAFRVIHGIGAVLIGFGFSMVLARLGQKAFYAGIVAGNGGFIILMVLSGDVIWLTGLVMFGAGIAFNAGRVLYAVMTAEGSNPDQRGVAMAVVGIYWASAQLIGPAAFGLLGDVIGPFASLMVAGALIMIPGLLTPLLYMMLGPRAVGKAPSETES
ncbi:MAG: MFS transporter [Dehalococcoidia bacterium]